VWVLPVGKGDSIVLQLPDGSWGVIDSHHRLDSAGSKQRAAALPVLKQMKEGELLRFICLTHYHKDHYLGLEEIFREIADSFDRNGAFFHSGFQYADAYEAMEWSGIEKLLSIRKRYFSDDDPSTHPIKECEMVNDNWDPRQLCESVKIQFLAPSSRDYGWVAKKLRECVRKERDNPRPFNRIGIAFTLTYDKATLLFTDDIEKPAWKRIKKRYKKLTPNLMMVSHHGSKDNNPDWLWRWLSRGRGEITQHAVISADGSRCHPDPNVVTRLRKQFTVHTTFDRHKSASPGSSSPTETMRRKTRRKKAETPVDNWRESAFPAGRVCSFEVFPTGRVVVK
jgi:hypothetical protein